MSGIPTPAALTENPIAVDTGNAEWPLLLTACSNNINRREPDEIRALCRSVRWKILFDLADRHGVEPLLCQALTKVEDAIPAAEQRYAKQLYQTNLHKSMFLARELIRVLDHLADRGIDVIPYKGVSLAETAYGDIASRKAGDIDLLIHSRDLPRVREAVGALGYVPQITFSGAQELAYMQTGYECAFDGPAGRNLLEVQWAIQPGFYAVDFDQEAMFQRAVSVTIAGHTMKSPSPEDLFIILALHAAKHVWGRLIWLCDLARIARLTSLDWNSISVQARKLGIARILRVTLLLLNHLFNVEIPAVAEAAISPDPTAAVIAEEIRQQLAHGQSYDVESVSYFRLMSRLRENRADRLRLLSRLAFTPGPSEWRAVRLPGPLFPLYRIVRVCRLAGKLARV